MAEDFLNSEVAKDLGLIKLQTSDGREGESLTIACGATSRRKTPRFVDYQLPDGYVRHSFSRNETEEGGGNARVRWATADVRSAGVILSASCTPFGSARAEVRACYGMKASGEHLPQINAGILHPNGNAYFFRGVNYQRYDFTPDRVDKLGTIGRSGWKGLWTDTIDAAVMHPNGKAYFFRGNEYKRFDFDADHVDKTARVNRDGWRGLWEGGIEAAVLHPNGKAYFFRGDEYQRFDFRRDEVDKTARIDRDGWRGLWRGGIDGAVMHPNGKAYFFRGREYARFDFGLDRIDKEATLGRDGWWGV